MYGDNLLTKRNAWKPAIPIVRVLFSFESLLFDEPSSSASCRHFLNAGIKLKTWNKIDDVINGVIPIESNVGISNSGNKP